MTRPDRVRRPWPWLMGAAIICGPTLAGCGENQQSTGPVSGNIPKESPVLTTGKESMNEFINSRKAQTAHPRK